MTNVLHVRPATDAGLIAQRVVLIRVHQDDVMVFAVDLAGLQRRDRLHATANRIRASVDTVQQVYVELLRRTQDANRAVAAPPHMMCSGSVAELTGDNALPANDVKLGGRM